MEMNPVITSSTKKVEISLAKVTLDRASFPTRTKIHFLLLFFIISIIPIFANSSDKNYWDPSHYHQYSEPQQRWALQLLDQYPFIGNEQILDIGCGDGKISRYIAQKVPLGNVTGIDYSSSMISFAQKEHGEIPNLKFMVGDAESFLLNDRYDLIVSFNCLHWVKNHTNVLTQIKAHLKQDGNLILHFSPLEKSHPLFKAIKTTFFNFRWIWYISNLNLKQTMQCKSIDEYRILMETEGFSAIKCAIIEQKTIFPSENAFREWLLGWLPFTSKMSDGLKRKFAHDITKKYLKITKQKEGDIVVFTHYPWEIKAQLR